MSANVYRANIKPMVGKQLSCWAPSSFKSVMEEHFGSCPWDLEEKDITELERLASKCKDGGGNPFFELVQAIRDNGPQHVWMEY